MFFVDSRLCWQYNIAQAVALTGRLQRREKRNGSLILYVEFFKLCLNNDTKPFRIVFIRKSTEQASSTSTYPIPRSLVKV